jgi:serine phosphatase RsbU (regulator of sigma subunit)
MNHTEQVNRIAQIPLFAVLPDEELEQLAGTLQPCEFASGSILMKEGESDDHFYAVLDGEAEVIKALGTPDERLLAIKPGGTLFGEMSLFSQQGCHTSSVRARTAIRALKMTRSDFDALLHRQPSLVYELVRLMSCRLEESENATILDLREKNWQLTQAYQELQAAQAQLIIKERLEKELAIARQIQENILPESLPQLPGFDIAALTVPARAVGGDYYDFFSVNVHHVGLVVGDACDKGIPAALLINLTNSLVHVEAPRNSSPEATLRVVNRHLLEMSRSGMFVCLLYGILSSSGQLDYCRAGHPQPVILDEDLHPIEIGCGAGMPLGLVEEIQLDARTVTIPPGGLAFIFSDGLSEAQDADGCDFSVDHLFATLPAISHLPAEQICAQLWDSVRIFSGDQPQADDFTVVVIKRAK